jgi:cytochrome c-type biogenesis protein CcmH
MPYLALILVSLSLLTVPQMHAQEAQLPEDTKPTVEMSLEEQTHFKSVAGMLRCPTCTGLSVLDSDAPFSLQIQALVKEQIKEGKNEEQIMDYFTERYGPWILREPPKKGVDLLAWLFPLSLMIFGPLAVWFFVWRRKRSAERIHMRAADDIVAEFKRALDAARSRGGVV